MKLLALAAACAVLAGLPAEAKKHKPKPYHVTVTPVVNVPGMFPAGLTFCSESWAAVTDSLSGTVYGISAFNTSSPVVKALYQFPVTPRLPSTSLLGITCDPATMTLYAYHSGYNVTNKLSNRVYSLKAGAGGKWAATLLWTSNAPVEYVNGGKIALGKDGYLYLSVGEIDGQTAQNKTLNSGKIVRMDKQGKVPASNPWPKNYAYTYGHRDSFGMTWDANGQLWIAEDGSSCNDEVNMIIPGQNYGWGPLSAAANGDESKACKGKAPHNTNMDGANVTLPVWYWPADTKTTDGLRPPSPTGIATCINCGIPKIEGQAVIGFVNAANLQLVPLNKVPAKPTEVTKPKVIHDNQGATILTVEAGVDGTLYFSDVTGTIYKISA